MTKYNFFLYFLSTAFLFFNSCSDDPKTQTNLFPAIQDTVTVDVGFPFNSRSFEYEGESYIYFYDLVTFKKVKLYDEDFNFVKTFSIDLFSDLGLYLKDIEMITPDSLVLLTDVNSNMLISLSIKSNKTELIDLNELVNFSEVEVPVQFKSSFNSGFKVSDELAFMVTPSLSAVSAKFPKSTPFGMIKTFDSISKLLPSFVTIKNAFSEGQKIGIVEKSQGLKKSINGRYNFFRTCSYIGNKELVLTSANLPFFDIYDLKSLKTKSKTIESEYTTVSVPSRKWTEIFENRAILYEGLPKKELNAAGSVYILFFDERNKRYHVYLLYSKESQKSEDSEIKPFVWQVYDEDFNLLDEREHLELNLKCTESFQSRKKVYLPYYNENSYDPEKAVFVRYTF